MQRGILEARIKGYISTAADQEGERNEKIKKQRDLLLGDNVYDWRCSGVLRKSHAHACDIDVADFVCVYVSDFLQ